MSPKHSPRVKGGPPGYIRGECPALILASGIGRSGFPCPAPDTPIASDPVTVHAETVALLVSLSAFEQRVTAIQGGEVQSTPKGSHGPWRAFALCLSRLTEYTDVKLFTEFRTHDVEYAGEKWPSYHRMTIELARSRFKELLGLLRGCNLRFRVRDLNRQSALDRFSLSVKENLGEIVDGWQFSPVNFDEVFRLLRYAEFEDWNRVQPSPPMKDTPKDAVLVSARAQERRKREARAADAGVGNGVDVEPSQQFWDEARSRESRALMRFLLDSPTHRVKRSDFEAVPGGFRKHPPTNEATRKAIDRLNVLLTDTTNGWRVERSSQLERADAEVWIVRPGQN